MEFLIMPDGWERHLDEEQAEKYSMGRLSEEEEARCEEHLLVCATCRQQVDSADQYVGAMKSAAAATAEMRPRRKSRFSWSVVRPVWALGLALLVLVGIFLVRYQPAGPPVAVHLSALRGAQQGTAPAGSDLMLFADLTGLAPAAGYRLELVDSKGQLLWSAPFAATGTRVPRQGAGVYFVRLRNARGELLREYGLQLAKTPAASNVPR
jgi:hypothetical protein